MSIHDTSIQFRGTRRPPRSPTGGSQRVAQSGDHPESDHEVRRLDRALIRAPFCSTLRRPVWVYDRSADAFLLVRWWISSGFTPWDRRRSALALCETLELNAHAAETSLGSEYYIG